MESEESNSLVSHKSLLSEYISKLECAFPNNQNLLTAKLNTLSDNHIPKTMHAQLLNENKKLIFNQFQNINDIVMDMYERNRKISKAESLTADFTSAVFERLAKEVPHFIMNTNGIDKDFEKEGPVLNESNEMQFINDLLRSLALHFCCFYNVQTDRGRLDEEYSMEIEKRINSYQNSISGDNFEELVFNNKIKKQSCRMALSETEAEGTASQTRSMINIKSVNESYLQENEWKSRNIRTQMSLKSSPKKETDGEINDEDLFTEIMLMHIENDKLETSNNYQIDNIEFYLDVDNLEVNKFSEISDYELDMMLHMVDMIFGNRKIELSYIKFNPYLQTLLMHLEIELQSLKSEEYVFKNLFESKMEYKGENGQVKGPIRKKSLPLESFIEDDKNSCEDSKEEKKPKKGFFSKLVGKKDKQKEQKEIKQERDIKRSNEKYQNVLIPESKEILQMFYSPTASDMESLYLYIKKFDQNVHEEDEKPNLKLPDNNDLYYHEVQSWMAVVMLLYRGLSISIDNNCEYTSFRRKQIINICKRIFKEENNRKKNSSKENKNRKAFRNWPIILKFLENNRPEILLAPSSLAIEKGFDEKIAQIYEEIKRKSLLGEKLEGMFKGLKVNIENLPKISLVCLSKNRNDPNSVNKTTIKCKVVNILISGFLSQDTDKVSEWSSMINLMPDSEVYALKWESNTIANLVKFFFKSAADVLGAVKMIAEIHRKYTDNPFNPAFEVAQVTGRILAEILINLFPNRFINLCGYSLGSEVIKECIRRINEMNHSHILNNVFVMGGVSDFLLCSEIVAQLSTPITFYNSYTMKDAVLKHMLSLCKPEIKPIGLNEMKRVEGHKVINVDCTRFTDGHLAFRTNLGVMGKIFEISIG